MSNSKNIKEIERILKALANSRRIEIIKLISKKEFNVSEIAEFLKLSIRATSRHLRVLDNSGIVNTRQEGLQVFYTLAKPKHDFVRIIFRNI